MTEPRLYAKAAAIAKDIREKPWREACEIVLKLVKGKQHHQHRAKMLAEAVSAKEPA